MPGDEMLGRERTLNRQPVHPASAGLRPVDGLLIGGREVWVVLARYGDEAASLLRAPQGPELTPLRLCRAVLADGRLVMGGADPGTDPLLSELSEPGSGR
jgi:hypothetical protein